MDTISVKGRTAVITGAGRGLGFGYARMLGARGARVVVNDIVGAPEAVAQLKEEGVEATANSDDVSTPEGAASLIGAARTAYGTIDILVNNAAIGRYSPMSEVTLEDYEIVRKVSLDASFYVTREAWPVMAGQQYGRVILTTSGNGLIGEGSSVAYSAAKGGVYGLMRALAIEGDPLGIKVNCIAPIASTPMAKSAVTEEVGKALDLEYPVELVAPALVLLASEECPVTGKVLDVAGGRVGSSFVGTVTGYYDRNLTPESILASWPEPVDRQEYQVFDRALTYMNTLMAEVKGRDSNN
jgi:NAD(P)-dependent dehydrogenase (short-subunit alcohol dehydrogenase family)